MMQNRSDKITNDLDNTAQSREDAAQLAAQRATELKSSKSEAVEIVNTAKQNGEKTTRRYGYARARGSPNLKTKC